MELRKILRSMKIGQSLILSNAPEIVKVGKGKYKYSSGVSVTEKHIVETFKDYTRCEVI